MEVMLEKVVLVKEVKLNQIKWVSKKQVTCQEN